MKLAEMSPLYEDSARCIQGRMEELRLRLRVTDDPECARQLRRRLAELQPLLRQCRKLSQLTAHYYDPDFCRYDEYSL